MLIYESTKNEFINSVENDTITDDIYKPYQKKIGKSSKAQIRSWHNSMEYMYKVLNDKNIPNDAGIAIEFTIPPTSKRVDFIISGLGKNNKKTIIIIELKQWEKAEKVEEKEDIVKTYVGKGLREVAHPSYQAWSYAALIEDFNQTVQKEEISLHPCAYLHNYKITKNDPIADKIYLKIIKKAPMYGSGDVKKLREFISKYINCGDNGKILYEIDKGKISPSRRLQDVLAKMLKGNEYFTMIDEQKIAYETAFEMGKKSKNNDKKRVLIIEGGPGTGKSVIAINLLVNLINEKLTTFYVTKNSAPRDVFFKELKGQYTQKYIKNIFKSSGVFYNSKQNEIDVLIVDEAHRLNEKSGFYGNQGENQIKEIINSAKTSIFFIDDYQQVTIKDIGSVSEIKAHATLANAEIEHIELTSQFRCNGSDGYLSWLNDVLQIKETANYDGFDYNYDFQVIDNPEKLKEIIFEKNKTNNKSRLLAGYCWKWPKENRKDTNYHDIQIEDFGMSWNLDSNEAWAIGKESVNEIGCIHTSQGLEFDYVGVILGEDIQCQDDKIITDFNQRANSDQSLKGIKKLYKQDPEKALQIADKVIKNTYRTLMTRGMKGCYIYCVDKELQEYFKRRVKMLK